MPQLFDDPAASCAPLIKALEAKASGWAKVQDVLQAALTVIPNADDSARRTIETMQP
jgi:hypothetical protein